MGITHPHTTRRTSRRVTLYLFAILNAYLLRHEHFRFPSFTYIARSLPLVVAVPLSHANWRIGAPHHPNVTRSHTIAWKDATHNSGNKNKGGTHSRKCSQIGRVSPTCRTYPCLEKSCFYVPMLETRETPVRFQTNAPSVHRLPLLTSWGDGQSDAISCPGWTVRKRNEPAS